MSDRGSGDHPRSTDPLVDASWGGRVEEVRGLLDAGADPGRRDDNGCSPLSAATRRGHVGVMRALLDAGADPDEVVDAATGARLLSVAASLGRVEGVRLLLGAGADPNRPRGEFYTVLMQAAGALLDGPGANLAGRVAMVRMLVDAGADVNAVTSRGMTPLGATCGDDELVRLLLEAGAVVTPARPGDAPLLVEVMGRHRPLRASQEAGVLRLIAAGADVNAADGYGETPLKRACAAGSPRVVAALLEAGARRVEAAQGRGGDPPPELHCAASGGDPDVVRRLLRDGAPLAEVDHAGRTPLYRAAVDGRVEAARVLLDDGADPDGGRERGRSPLRAAAYHGHEACAALLIDAGADVNAGAGVEPTALHLAALMRRLKVVPLLLRAGAAVDARDADGRTPLMWALQTRGGREGVWRRAAATADLLLAAGADPRATDRLGRSVLFDAARAGLVNEVRRLLALGLDVNAPALDGLTPLMAAVSAPGLDARSAEALLSAGADPHAVDRGGASALHWALRPHEPPEPASPYRDRVYPHVDKILAVLLKAGVDVNRADGLGRTPLMLASLHTHFDLVTPLLRAGADRPDPDPSAGQPGRSAVRANRDAGGRVTGSGKDAAPGGGVGRTGEESGG